MTAYGWLGIDETFSPLTYKSPQKNWNSLRKSAGRYESLEKKYVLHESICGALTLAVFKFATLCFAAPGAKQNTQELRLIAYHGHANRLDRNQVIAQFRAGFFSKKYSKSGAVFHGHQMSAS